MMYGDGLILIDNKKNMNETKIIGIFEKNKKKYQKVGNNYYLIHPESIGIPEEIIKKQQSFSKAHLLSGAIYDYSFYSLPETVTTRIIKLLIKIIIYSNIIYFIINFIL